MRGHELSQFYGPFYGRASDAGALTAALTAGPQSGVHLRMLPRRKQRLAAAAAARSPRHRRRCAACRAPNGACYEMVKSKKRPISKDGPAPVPAALDRDPVSFLRPPCARRAAPEPRRDARGARVAAGPGRRRSLATASPQGREEFFKSTWEQKPLLIKADDARKSFFTDLFNFRCGPASKAGPSPAASARRLRPAPRSARRG
jgi:hypothetical protein